MKRSRLLNILCSMLVGVIFMIAMLAVMIFSGAVSLQRTDLVFSTESASAVYDGKPLTNHKWKLVSGELKQGHRAQVTVTGSQTSSGESDNTIQVKILDAADADVTGDYTINYKLGKLKVTPRMLTVTSKGATKVFDGQPLTTGPDDYEVNGIIPGHKALVLLTGSQTEVGYSPNTIQMIRIVDRGGSEVTHNYQVTKIEGPLMVTNGNSGLNFSEQDNDINPDELAKTILYKITAGTTGKVYLKSQSYGDYTGNGFNTADKYTPLIDSKYAASYLPAFTLWSQGYTNKSWVIVKPQSGAPYVLPYNMTIQEYDGYDIQVDDTGSFGAAEKYTVDFYISDTANPMGSGSAYNGYEQEYRKYVYSKYVGVDSETLAYMRTIISENSFRSGDKDIIKKVANYIKLSAAYSFDYDKNLNDCENIAVSFLKDYKEGVCKHYAMAATVLYRSLGIPARYTEGVVADVVAGAEVDVSALNAHAWVEVYIDGFGWQMVEVTGGPSAGGEDVGKDGLDFTNIPDAELSREELENKELYKVLAGKKGPIYLKAVSYGDYVGYGFRAAMAYPNLLDYQYAASYLTPITLKNSDFITEPTITITNISENMSAPYVLPYYASTDIGEGISGYTIQQDDTKSVGDASVYSLKYYKYHSNYSADNNPYSHQVYEQGYYAFVKEQYLEIDDQTKEYMESIIILNDFKVDNPNIISDIAKYIQSSAKYNFNYDKKLDKSTNIAISFLKDYKEGVCRHYAMAATMLYRALGIPARYTEGVIVNAEKDTEVVVNAMMRHAWVEVYVEGIGWQMVEVTGGYGQEHVVPDKEIAPEDIHMYYEDGDELDASVVTTLAGFEKYAAMGYRYENLSVKGKQSGIGKSQSTIRHVTIYDKDGNDVTDEFIFKPGEVQIYRDILKPVDVEKQYIWGMPPLLPQKKLEDLNFEGFEEKYPGYSIDPYTFFVNGSQATPGKSKSTVKKGIIIRDKDGNDVTGEFRFADGDIHVYRAELKPFYIEKQYDPVAPTPLVYTEYYPNNLDGFEPYAMQGYYIENLDVSRYTEPGKYESVIESKTIFLGEKDVTDEFKFVDGEMHIYREILYPWNSEKKYDGNPFDYMYYINNSDFHYEYALNGFEKYAIELGYGITELVVTPFTEPGKHEIEVKQITICDANGNAYNANGQPISNEFKFENAGLHIYREILRPKTISKQYDGTPLYYTEKTLENFDDYAEHYTIYNLIVNGYQTEPGSSESTIDIDSIAIFFGGKDVTDEFKFDNGTITVVERDIKVQSNDIEFYFGEQIPHREVYVPNDSGSLLSGHSLNVEFVNDNIDFSNANDNPGYPNEFIFKEYKIIDEYGNDVTRFYNINETIYGTVKILRRTITVTTDSAEKTYDGQPLIHAVVGAVEDGDFPERQWNKDFEGRPCDEIRGYRIVVNDNYPISSQIEPTGPDGVPNIFTVKIVDANGNDVTKNYNITYDYGTLTVNKRDIKVQSNDIEFYFGEQIPHREVYVPNDGGSLLNGHHLNVEFVNDNIDSSKANDYPDAPRYLNKFIFKECKISDEDGNDVTHFYNINETIYGTVKILRRTITVTTESAEKTYDGQPLIHAVVGAVEDGDFPERQWNEISGHEMVVNDNYPISSQIEPTGPDGVPNIFTVKIVDANGNDVTANYNIEYVYGTLTVNKCDIKVQSEDILGAEIGTQIKDENRGELTIENLPDGYTLNVEFTHDYLNIKDINTLGKNEFKIISIKDANGHDVNIDYFNIEAVYGEIRFSQRNIEITSSSASENFFELGGEPLVCEEYEITDGSIIVGDKIEVYFKSGQRYPGVSQNIFTVKIFANGNDVTANYNITYVYGTLTVTLN